MFSQILLTVIRYTEDFLIDPSGIPGIRQQDTLHSTLMPRVRSNLTNGSAAFFYTFKVRSASFYSCRVSLKLFFTVSESGKLLFYPCCHG